MGISGKSPGTLNGTSRTTYDGDAPSAQWPGLARGATSGEAAIERLLSYVPRYATVAKLAGMDAAFTAITAVDVVEHYPGTGSTDFGASRSRFRASTGKPCQVKHWSVNCR